jgi:hypothetical protein
MAVGSTQDGVGFAKENAVAPTWTSLSGAFAGADWELAPLGAMKTSSSAAARAAKNSFICRPPF